MKKILILGAIALLSSCQKGDQLLSSSLTLDSQKSSISLIQPNTNLKWYDDVLAFRIADQTNMPAAGGDVFIGSSTITLWPNMQSSFEGYPVIQRGFGGSTLQDLINYASDIVTPYDAKQVVIICGDNDIYIGHKSWKVLSDFTNLFNKIRSENPDIRISFVSIKPTPYMYGANPKGINFGESIENSNRLIKDFISKQQNAEYIDVFSKLMGWNPKHVRPELFKSDGMHPNAAGYAIYSEVISPSLFETEHAECSTIIRRLDMRKATWRNIRIPGQ